MLIENGYAHSLRALLEKGRAEQIELAARRAQGDSSGAYAVRVTDWIARLYARVGKLRVGTALAALLIASAGCSGRPPDPVPQKAAVQPPGPDRIPAADLPPSSLLQLGQSAMELFDAAWASDWTRAAESLLGLHDAESGLPADLPAPDLVAQLQSRVANATNAANSRQRVETMDAANAITHIVAEQSAEYICTVPYQLKLLGYYGRQIEVGIASGRMTTIARASTDIEQNWNRVRPVIEQRGQTAVANQLTDLVADLIGASRPADFDRPARAILAAVDGLERQFAGRSGEPCSESLNQ